MEQLPVNTLEETPVTTRLRKLPGHIVRKELTSTGSRGGHELFQLNPTWNRLQPGQGSELTATEHRLRVRAGVHHAPGEEPGLRGQTAPVWVVPVT